MDQIIRLRPTQAFSCPSVDKSRYTRWFNRSKSMNSAPDSAPQYHRVYRNALVLVREPFPIRIFSITHLDLGPSSHLLGNGLAMKKACFSGSPWGKFIERMCKLSLEPLMIIPRKGMPAPTHNLQAPMGHILSWCKDLWVGDFPINISNGFSPSACGRPYSGPCQACFRSSCSKNLHRPWSTK